MQNFTSKDILALDKSTYSAHFENKEFGLSLGSELALKHGYKDPLTRIPEGSSLVFKIGSDHFLKITPPFYSGSIEAEIAATKIIGDQLSFSIPHILINDQIEKWNYVITKNVKGQQAKNVYRTMTPENVKIFAKDIGKVIKNIHSIKIHFKRFKKSQYCYSNGHSLVIQKKETGPRKIRQRTDCRRNYFRIQRFT